MRLLNMGPPGAGKGTQATMIADRYGIPAISTGEMFRRHIKGETELGLAVNELIQAGKYVPDELTEAMVAERLAEPDCEPGFLLDGFPRTLHQVQALDEILEAREERLDAVISLVADVDEVVSRLLKRANIEGRQDDNEDTIRKRQALYLAETEPLLDEYRRRGILSEIDALGAVDEVAARIGEALDTALVD